MSDSKKREEKLEVELNEISRNLNQGMDLLSVAACGVDDVIYKYDLYLDGAEVLTEWVGKLTRHSSDVAYDVEEFDDFAFDGDTILEDDGNEND